MRYQRLLSPRGILLLAATVILLAFVPSGKAIVNGQPDGERHPYVVVIRMDPFVCSGFLVTPTLAVTAAHCFPEPGGPVLVSNAPHARAPGVEFTPGTWHPDPQFCACEPGSIDENYHDIAVVRLDEPIELARYARLPDDDFVEHVLDRPNATVDIVGYGVSFFDDGRPVLTGERMFGTSGVDEPASALAQEFIQLDSVPSALCFGDSGAPSLVGDIAVALGSFIESETCSGAALAYRLDIRDARDFLRPFLPPGYFDEDEDEDEEDDTDDALPDPDAIRAAVEERVNARLEEVRERVAEKLQEVDARTRELPKRDD